MRGLGMLLSGAVAACGFGPAVGGDGPGPTDSDGATGDGPIDGMPGGPNCNGKVWFANFTTDPTQQDRNGDGTNDWVLRSGDAFNTSELSGGVWRTGPGDVLDTQPPQPFITRTIVDVTMRSVDSSGARGAIFWINVGFDAANTFAPMFVDVKLISTTQRVSFVKRNPAGMEQNFAQTTGQPAGFIDIHLDIDGETLMAQYAGGGNTGTAQLDRQNAPGPDRWASLTSFNGDSEFDSITVEVCPE